MQLSLGSGKKERVGGKNPTPFSSEKASRIDKMFCSMKIYHYGMKFSFTLCSFSDFVAH